LSLRFVAPRGDESGLRESSSLSCSRLLKRAAELSADYAAREGKRRRARLHRVLKLNRVFLSVVLRSVKDSRWLPAVVESVPVSLAIGSIKCPRKAESGIGAPTPEVRRRNAPELWNPIAAAMLFIRLFFSPPSPIPRPRVTRNIFPFNSFYFKCQRWFNEYWMTKPDLIIASSIRNSYI